MVHKIESQHLNHPMRGGHYPEEHLKGGGFPGAVGSEQANGFSGLNLERDVIHRGEIAEPLGQVLNANDGSRHEYRLRGVKTRSLRFCPGDDRFHNLS